MNVSIAGNDSTEPFCRVGQYCFYSLKMENGSVEVIAMAKDVLVGYLTCLKAHGEGIRALQSS